MLCASAAVAVAALAAAAVAHPQASTPKAGGNAKAGKAVFVSTCGACHTLKAAKSVGTIGPDLDKVMLSQAALVKAITKGGAAVMSKQALSNYPTRMTPYGGVLTPAQIQDVAAFVFASTHPAKPAAAALKVTLKAPGHKPRVGAHWKYSVHAVSGGKAAAGKITVQIVDPTGHAHPVQLGMSKKNIVNRHFKGTFADFVVWPVSSRGVPLTFRVTVHVGKAKKVVNYRVTSRK
jgi:mono/diheme cytochrome c family protein